MKYFTPEQIKQLKELDVIQHFNTVLDSEYKRGTTSLQDNGVADIYDEATGGKVSRHFNCKTCVYNLYRNAGNLYRQSLDYIKKESMKKARDAKNKKKDKETELVPEINNNSEE